MIRVTSVKTMRQSDSATILGGVSGRELMARAGRGIYQSYAWKGPVAIVCGSGNNAGDGYVLALELLSVGIECTLVLLFNRFSEDGAYYFGQCREAGVPVVAYTEDFSFDAYSEIVDCIFGTGFSGEVVSPVREVIEKINGSGKAVICADINSGLNGDSGNGALCVKSDLTVSIGTYKTGHFLGDAKDSIKARCNLDIGIDVPDEGMGVCEASDFCDVLYQRKQNSHKGSYGYVCVMGGSREYSGAVKLANMSAAALRAGCGVVQLAVPSAIADSVSPYLLESTLLPVPSKLDGHMKYTPALLDTLLSRMAAIAVGMGWGTGSDHEKILAHLLSNGEIPLVIDADGLNTLSRLDKELLRKTRCAVTVTPHPKEFERLCGVSVAEILKDPIRYAKDFAKEYGVTVLLKGCTTVVTDGDCTYLIDRGCAGMGTAGSGDVLSGILAGLMGYAPANAKTVACGAYIAGRAGELAEGLVNPISMVASDTVACIARAIGEMI